MIFLYLAGIVFFSFVLIKATDLLTVHLKILGKRTALGGFLITSVIVGLATSLPELSVGITAAIEGIPQIALGNVIGSNIANLTIISGTAALVAGALKIQNGGFRKDMLHAFGAGILPLLLLIDGTLSRVDGLVLLVMYGYYNYLLIQKRTVRIEEEDGIVVGLMRRFHPKHIGKHAMYILGSLALVLLSADTIVRLSINIAENLGIQTLLVGLFIVAIGTSLPELAFGLRAIKKDEPKLFMGNLLGSTVANSTLILGITALIFPIALFSIDTYVIAIVYFFAAMVMFYYFIFTKHRLDRWEGVLLILLYGIFVAVELAN